MESFQYHSSFEDYSSGIGLSVYEKPCFDDLLSPKNGNVNAEKNLPFPRVCQSSSESSLSFIDNLDDNKEKSVGLFDSPLISECIVPISNTKLPENGKRTDANIKKYKPKKKAKAKKNLKKNDLSAKFTNFIIPDFSEFDNYELNIERAPPKRKKISNDDSLFQERYISNNYSTWFLSSEREIAHKKQRNWKKSKDIFESTDSNFSTTREYSKDIFSSDSGSKMPSMKTVNINTFQKNLTTSMDVDCLTPNTNLSKKLSIIQTSTPQSSETFKNNYPIKSKITLRKCQTRTKKTKTKVSEKCNFEESKDISESTNSSISDFFAKIPKAYCEVEKENFQFAKPLENKTKKKIRNSVSDRISLSSGKKTRDMLKNIRNTSTPMPRLTETHDMGSYFRKSCLFDENLLESRLNDPSLAVGSQIKQCKVVLKKLCSTDVPVKENKSPDISNISFRVWMTPCSVILEKLSHSQSSFIPSEIVDPVVFKKLPSPKGLVNEVSPVLQMTPCSVILDNLTHLESREMAALKNGPSTEELRNERNSIDISEVSTDLTMKPCNVILNKLTYLESSFVGDKLVDPFDSLWQSFRQVDELSAEEKILMLCDQREVIELKSLFSEGELMTVQKVGEGSYAEVYKIKCHDDFVVLKIVPVEGVSPSGETQLTYDEVLSELIISKEINNLSENRKNQAPTFIDVKRISLVQGQFPKKLLNEWKKFSDERNSENDYPGDFRVNQRFVVFQYGYGGQELENFTFSSGDQILSVLQQIACGIAVAEVGLKFEHRDLHEGNILVSKTNDEFIEFVIDGEIIKCPCSGFVAKIIDFTLSRLEKDGVPIYKDLSEQGIFSGQGDSQYDVYRSMRTSTKSDWQGFHPITNVLWVTFLMSRLCTRHKKFFRKGTKALKTLNNWIKSVKKCSSILEFVKKMF